MDTVSTRGIALLLAAKSSEHPQVSDVTEIHSNSQVAEFVITLGNGQRFNVTVQES